MNESLKKIEDASLIWLRNKLKKEEIVHKKSQIPVQIYNYLRAKLFLESLSKSYVFLKRNDELAELSLKTNFYIILFQFLNLSFPDGWYFNGSCAYSLLLEDFSINGKQFSIVTKAKSNRIIRLLDLFEIYATYDKNFEEKPLIKKKFFKQNLYLLKAEYLIINATPNDYKNYKDELLALLKNSERDEKYIVEYFRNNKSDVLLARLIGALRAVGDFTLCVELEELYKIYGVTVPIKNPFEAYTLFSFNEKPAYINRFNISLLNALEYLKTIKKPQKRRKKFSVRDLDAVIVDDTYHSLTIEGYTVTRSLISFLESHGRKYSSEAELKDQLAVKGFMNGLNYIKKLIDKKIVINENLAKKLFEELWKPSINANLVDSEFDIYRKHMVSIRGSMYVPPNHEKIPDLLNELFQCSREIEDGFILGIFLHFFYVSIHPHSDGNGRLSRFLMNLAFVNASYNWLTIKAEQRNEYFKSLEQSQLEDNIKYFADFILGQIPDPKTKLESKE